MCTFLDVYYILIRSLYKKKCNVLRAVLKEHMGANGMSAAGPVPHSIARLGAHQGQAVHLCLQEPTRCTVTAATSSAIRANDDQIIADIDWALLHQFILLP